MQDVEQLLKTTLSELRSIVNAETVVGDPISVDGTTIIPIVRVGFGFGTGGGGGKDANKGGQAGATGAGAGVEPVAFLIIDEAGTRLEPVVKAAASGASPTDKIMELIKDQVISRFGKSANDDDEDDSGEG